MGGGEEGEEGRGKERRVRSRKGRGNGRRNGKVAIEM